jgi:hypothetical protein
MGNKTTETKQEIDKKEAERLKKLKEKAVKTQQIITKDENRSRREFEG